MKAQPLDLVRIFQSDVRYVVPIFQRRYVWTQDDQWEGLWEDLTDAVGAYRRSEELKRLEPQTTVVVPTHFLGAIVLDEAFAGTGRIDASLVIDGQQRLTTLQVILAALRSVAEEVGDEKQARLVARLLSNDPDLVDEPPDQYKVWPSKKDRDAFSAVMAGQPEAHPENRISKAYVYFREQIVTWALEEPGSAIADLAETVRRYVRVVVIDLEEGDNAQVIFESLNYGGEELLAIDLVKNHVFQRAERAHEPVESLYEDYWQAFEDTHWSEKIRQGRLFRPRAELFLMHWLKMKLVEEVNAHRLFVGFRQVLDTPGLSGGPEQTIKELARDRDIYSSFDDQPAGSVERDFFERVAVLDTTTHLPLALALFRQPEEILSIERRERALAGVESWLIRRLLCRLTTKNYNRIFLDLIGLVEGEPGIADDVIIDHLKGLDGDSQRWPTDSDLDSIVPTVRFYGWLTQSRVVMVLKAVENHWRAAKSEERLTTSNLTIEHVMPQTWETPWPLPEGSTPERIAERNAAVHALGNLTLVTGRLNSSMSNSPWPIKQKALNEFGVLLLNSRMIEQSPDVWDERQIAIRSTTLLRAFKEIWPHPAPDPGAAAVA